MYRIFVFKSYIPKEKYSILNTNSDLMIERYRNEDDMWEMPENMVQEIFAGNENLACDLTCTVSKIDDDNSSFPFIVTFTKPIENIYEIKNEKLYKARQLLKQKLKEYSDYPEEESNTFSIQEKEARAYIENNNIPKEEIPLITNISNASNTNLLDLSKKIIEHADTFTQIKGFYLGKHKKARDMIYNAKTKEELESINVEAIFNEEI